MVRVSDRPADDAHHYGHGKIESLSALGVIAMLYVLAGGILVEAYSRLRDGAPPPTFSWFAFGVLGVDIVVNLWRAWALHRTAVATKSQALAADALHFASDVLGSFAVIAGLTLSAFGFAWGDAAAAIGVAVMISILGLRLGRSTIQTLLDRAPEGVSEKAREAISAVPGVVGDRAAAGADGRPDAFHRRLGRGAAHLSDRPHRRDQAPGAAGGDRRCSTTPTSPSPRSRWRATTRACASASW